MSEYCEIYVNPTSEKSAFARDLLTLVNGTAGRWTIETNWGSIRVNRNEGYDPAKCALERDGFLYFRYYLEVDPHDGMTHADYVQAIGELLYSLWQSGIPAVAACDFEDELPVYS